MYDDKDSIIIDGINIGQYITEAKFGYNKLWSNDTGRNLAGNMVGTFKGIFPKITLKFRSLEKEELNIIAPLLNKARQNLQYYDPEKNKKITIETYTGDWELVSRSIEDGQPFSCAFISTKKRS